MSKIIVKCQVCNIFLYEKDGGGVEGVSSSFCPHCFVIFTKLQEAMSDHRGVVSEVVSKILRDYQKDVRVKVLETIMEGKYQGRVE